MFGSLVRSSSFLALTASALWSTAPTLVAFQGSDSCATPTVVTGTGPHAFDTTSATTGSEGQVDCFAYSQSAIQFDVWFQWVAPTSDTYVLSTCGMTDEDTKVAVRPGCGLSDVQIGCDDDIHLVLGGNYASRAPFVATVGQVVWIQIGISPLSGSATGGPGLFTVTPQAGATQPPFVRDDGSSESAIRASGGSATTLWMAAQGDLTTGSRTVTGIEAAIGSLALAGVTGATNGATIQLGVWEDPNDDGDPIDAVLKTSASLTAVASAVDTDILTSYAVPPVNVAGVFFVGVAYNHGVSTGLPCPVDVDGCSSQPGQNWIYGNTSTTVSLSALGSNSLPHVSLGGGVDGVGLLLRSNSAPTPPASLYCFGSSSSPVCPCGNASALGADEGCLNSLGLGGKLRFAGVPSVSADTFVIDGSNMPNGPGLYFQGPTQPNGGNGNMFGDGKRCVGGSTIRLGVVLAPTGASTYPSGAVPPNNVPISIKGAVTAGANRNYQLWYRDSAPSFCTTSTFNLTNGVNVVWAP